MAGKLESKKVKEYCEGVEAYSALAGRLSFLLALAHRARAAFCAICVLRSGVRFSIRTLAPFLPPFLPPLRPISRITSEIRSSSMGQILIGLAPIRHSCS